MTKQKLRWEFVFASTLLIILCGCGDQSAESLLGKANSTNIQKLANLYNQYQAEHNFLGPDSMETFKQYIENDVPAFIKERIELTSTEDLFVSERDGLPFKIRFEILGSARGCTEPAIFESEGQSGNFLVGFLNMTTREVEKIEYDQLWSDGNAS